MLMPQPELGQEDTVRKAGAPPAGTILKGVVQSIKAFGFFVALEGWLAHGLVHISQV